MAIMVVGSVALDTVETPFGREERILGGSAVHFGVAASFFTELQLVAVIGNDFPEAHIDFLKTRGIDLEGLETIRGGKTFHWQGRYDYDLSNPQTLKTELNVFETFKPRIPAAYKKAKYVFLANIDPVLQKEVLGQIDSPRLVACDTMNFWIESKPRELKEMIRHVNVLMINEGEARLFAKERNLVKAARKIQSWGPKTLVVKQGEYGALLFHEEQIFSAPGLPLEEIKDPTGAGDSFAGGFMGYLSKMNGADESEDLKQAVIYGSVMASFNVEEFSCDRMRSLSQEDILYRYGEFRNLAKF